VNSAAQTEEAASRMHISSVEGGIEGKKENLKRIRLRRLVIERDGLECRYCARRGFFRQTVFLDSRIMA